MEFFYGSGDINRTELAPFFIVQRNRPLLKVYSIMEHNGPAWVAEYPRLPGVVGTEQSIRKAIKDLERNARFHLEGMRSLGMSIPEEFR